MIKAWDETKTIRDWAADARCSVTYEALLKRLRSGWVHEDAISLPPQTGGRPRTRVTIHLHPNQVALLTTPEETAEQAVLRLVGDELDAIDGTER
jgi:hypothetical protein